MIQCEEYLLLNFELVNNQCYVIMWSVQAPAFTDHNPLMCGACSCRLQGVLAVYKSCYATNQSEIVLIKLYCCGPGYCSIIPTTLLLLPKMELSWVFGRATHIMPIPPSIMQCSYAPSLSYYSFPVATYYAYNYAHHCQQLHNFIASNPWQISLSRRLDSS